MLFLTFEIQEIAGLGGLNLGFEGFGTVFAEVTWKGTAAGWAEAGGKGGEGRMP